MISQLLAKKKKKKEYILNTLGLRWWTESSVKGQGWSVQSISQRAALRKSSLMYWSLCVGCRCWAVNIAAWMTVNNQQAGVHHQQSTILTEGHVWIDFKHKQAAGICFLYLPIDNITSLRLEGTADFKDTRGSNQKVLKNRLVKSLLNLNWANFLLKIGFSFTSSCCF